MKLSKIRILNFRSILDQEVVFNENCLGLIGRNESGKSNVLNAIRILDDSYELSIQDRSKISRQFPTLQCEFSVNEDDIQKINTKIGTLVEGVLGKNTPFIKYKEGHSIKKVVNVTLDNGTLNRIVSFEIPIVAEFSKRILRRITLLPTDMALDIDGKNVPGEFINMIEEDNVPDELHSHFTPYGIDEIKEDLIPWIIDSFVELSPQVIFWEYDRKYLLPSEIKYEDFIAEDKPYGNSAPLYNIFLLSKKLGIKDVNDLKNKIVLWKADASERRKDSAIITESINKYIKGIWSDYDQELNIELEESKITILINDPNSEEKNFYSMEARSQGFKTFISFILTIAAEAESGSINNFILLLDEPETHLHPSGVRYMREELLKLSDHKNHIVFSTHSIFMVDRKMLKRHIKVVKEQELTRLVRIERNNFIQEAVIYEAMGTRVDEFSIGAKNIIVEGELDLKLVDLFIKLHSDQDVNKYVSGAEIMNGGGTKAIKEFLGSMILPHNSHWTLILDNDKPAQDLAKYALTFKDKSYKILCHHYTSVPNQELEDILPRAIVQSAIEASIDLLGIQNTTDVDFSVESKIVSTLTNEFVNKQKLSPDQKSQFEKNFKIELDKKVNEIIISIESLPIDSQLQEFKNKLSVYYEAIAKVLLKPSAKQTTDAAKEAA